MLRANEPVVKDAREQLLKVTTDIFQHALTSLPEVNYVKNVETDIEKEAKKATAKKKTTRKKKAGKKTAKKTARKKTAK